MKWLQPSRQIPYQTCSSLLQSIPSNQPATNRSSLTVHLNRILDPSSPRSWALAIADLSRSGDYSSAFITFKAARRIFPEPLRSAFPATVSSCAAQLDLFTGRQLHALALRSGLLPMDLFVASSIVSMYSNCNNLLDARKVFDETPNRNNVLWTAVISGHGQYGFAREALLLFKRFLAESGYEQIDSAAAVSALAACSRMNSVTATSVIHGLCFKVGLEPEISVYNTLIDAYAKGREIRISRKVFDEMPERDVVSWNSMIALYGQNGLAAEALQLYSVMMNESSYAKYNAVTLSAVLLACAHAGALQSGKCVHNQVIKMFLADDVYVGTSVVDMYCKCGRVMMARKAFEHLKDKNVKSWSAMIAGYGMHGRGREALEVFYEMRNSVVKPNEVTFVSVLAACSHTGLLQEGRHWFSSMINEYEIEPIVEHYACMVDLLGRAGCLFEAYELIREMRIKPDSVVWGALLSACRIHKNVELGEISAKELFELDSKNCGYYVLLSSIYADAGRWEEAQRMRLMIKSRGITKAPGYSSVELKGRIHVFLVGHKIHPMHEEIYEYLEKLKARLLESGYVPDTKSVLHDVDEEEKETVLRVHSEKLAVAFAIISTAHGTPIQVIKNLRVCGDCHTVLKLIAKLEDREIVVRDSHRFHHFLNGKCSCGDYW